MRMPDTKAVIAVAIFILGYLLIGARPPRWMPIGRPMGAALAAALMVAAGVLTPRQALESVDLNTLVLLGALLLMGVYLRDADCFAWAAARFFPSRLPAATILHRLVWGSGLLSAVLLNDTMALFCTPLVLILCRRSGLAPLPFLLALATSVNIGSALTLAGNPQNVIIASASHLPFLDYLLLATPIVLGALAINEALLRANFGASLVVPQTAEPVDDEVPEVDRRADRQARNEVFVAMSVMVFGWILGVHLALMAVLAVAGLAAWRRRDAGEPIAKLDWGLLVFFAGLFVIMAGLNTTGLTRLLYEEGYLHRVSGSLAERLPSFALITVIGSNLFSNVPYVLAVAHNLQPVDRLPATAPLWTALAIISTFAGNLTLMGSVANLIVAEGARATYTLGFREYLRFGVQTTLATCVWAVLVLIVEGMLLGWG